MAEHSVLAIEMRRRAQRDEELRAIRARTAVRHRKRSLVLMLQRRHNLILELAAVDRAATTASAGWVTALNHEAGDDAVEDDVVVLASAGELGEVLASLYRGDVSEL